MKQYILLSAILFTGMIFLASCKKMGHGPNYITLNETVKSGTTYSLNVSAYGDDDDKAIITTQAQHYAVSQLDQDASAKSIYHFSADTKSQTNETVVITLTEDHSGRPGPHCNHDEAVITINFTVTQ